MSGKAAAAPADGEAGAGAGKKKKILLIVIILVVVLAAGGGAAWFFLGGKKKSKGHGKADAEHAEQSADGSHDSGEDEDEPEDDSHAKPPVFVTLEPFTVNLASEASDRYLQVGIDLKVAAPDVAEKIKVHLPEIRNGILLILTSKKVDELGKVEGKNQLRIDIRDAVNKPIGMYKAPPESADPLKWKPKKGAVDVLLTSFVIQ
jgi:flagellar FliL protein